tara:strand:+ start:1031 stop:3097 length:2067 start_codon:yes stop_codon:yes gene_type:complete
MPLQKTVFRPGINREGTAYDNEGGWFDCNLVRFRKGRPEKFGGWSKITENTYLGTARALHAWISLAGTKYLGFGTTFKYYIESGGTFNDITPIRLTTSAGDVTFTGKANTLSSGITATDTTIPLTSSTGFPASGTVQIGSETINYAAVSGNNLIGATRGAESTTAATHSSSDAVLCATLTITDTSHGAIQNDFVTFSGASSLGGNITAAVLNQEYQVLNVINANSYTIKAKDTSSNTVFANSSDSGNGGSSVVGTYQINVGLDVYVPGTGWGINGWGEGTFGSTSSLSSTNQLRLWSHDNYGEDLIINARNAGIFKWTENNGVGTRAVELSGISGANLVPTVGLQVITSETDRHLIVLGADPISGTSRTGVIDPMLIVFSDQENELEFEPLSTNTAGSLRLSSGSSIIGGIKARQEILVWTDTAIYSMQFIGPPFTFAVNLLNEGTGLIGPKAAVNTPGGVYWMSYNNFYSYNGSVQTLPCSVHNYVFSDINLTQSFKTNAFTIKDKSEVGWFYCSSSSDEVDRYVIYNYVEGIWFYGQLSRTAWLDSGIVNYPRAVSSGYLYQQETGFNDDGSPMTNVFIESSDFDLDDGQKFAFARRIIPDFKFIQDPNNGSVNVVVKTRNFPGDTLATNSTNAISSSTQQSHIRARARQMALRIESDDDATNNGNLSIGWRLGATRIDIKTDGQR